MGPETTRDPPGLPSRGGQRASRRGSGANGGGAPPPAGALELQGRRFVHHHTRPSGVALFRAADGGAYLRIGPRGALEPEYRSHAELRRRGFPVAALLAAGEDAGRFYYVEAALGPTTLGDAFEAETRGRGEVGAAGFARFLRVALRWTRAQLRTASAQHPDGHGRAVAREELAAVVRLEGVLTELPELRTRTLRGFERALARLRAFPAAPTHGDFHAYNACVGGVIDLERAGPGGLRGPAGYDALTGLLVPECFPPAPDAYRYTARQQRRYLAALDALFVAHRLPPPSAHAADFRFCTLLACVPDRHHRPAQQRWLYARYRTELDAYGPDAPLEPPALREP